MMWLPPEPIPLTLDAEHACRRGHVAQRFASGRLYCAVCEHRRNKQRGPAYWRMLRARAATMEVQE